MIVCVANVIGTMTPPVAVNIFAATTVSNSEWGYRKSQTPFFIGYLAVFIAAVLIPGFSTFILK
jgi:C4-dicarboxylate transporter DctM subunit